MHQEENRPARGGASKPTYSPTYSGLARLRRGVGAWKWPTYSPPTYSPIPPGIGGEGYPTHSTYSQKANRWE